MAIKLLTAILVDVAFVMVALVEYKFVIYPVIAFSNTANKFVVVPFVIEALVENICVEVELLQVALPPLVWKPVFSTQFDPSQRSVELVAVPEAIAPVERVCQRVDVPVDTSI